MDGVEHLAPLLLLLQPQLLHLLHPTLVQRVIWLVPMLEHSQLKSPVCFINGCPCTYLNFIISEWTSLNMHQWNLLLLGWFWHLCHVWDSLWPDHHHLSSYHHYSSSLCFPCPMSQPMLSQVSPWHNPWSSRWIWCHQCFRYLMLSLLHLSTLFVIPSWRDPCHLWYEDQLLLRYWLP